MSGEKKDPIAMYMLMLTLCGLVFSSLIDSPPKKRPKKTDAD